MAESYSLTRTSIEWLRKMKRDHQRKVIKRPAAIRPIARGGDGFPLRLAKPQSGETLDGSTPGTLALCSIYAATPGSETAVETDVPVYPGRALGSGNTIDDTTYFICGEINGYLQFVSPAEGTGTHTARFAHATLTGAMTTSESAKVVTIVRTWDGTAVTGDVTAYNVPDPTGPGSYLFEGLRGAISMLSYDPENDKWWFVWVECGAAAAATASMAVKGKPPQPSVAAMNSEAIFDLT